MHDRIRRRQAPHCLGGLALAREQQRPPQQQVGTRGARLGRRAQGLGHAARVEWRQPEHLFERPWTLDPRHGPALDRHLDGVPRPAETFQREREIVRAHDRIARRGTQAAQALGRRGHLAQRHLGTREFRLQQRVHRRQPLERQQRIARLRHEARHAQVAGAAHALQDPVIERRRAALRAPRVGRGLGLQEQRQVAHVHDRVGINGGLR